MRPNRAVKFPSPILVEYRPSCPKFFQTGRISPNSAQKKTMSRISANLDDIRPNRWRKFNWAHSIIFKRISAKKKYCEPHCILAEFNFWHFCTRIRLKFSQFKSYSSLLDASCKRLLEKIKKITFVIIS
jgi:hypothetical protein